MNIVNEISIEWLIALAMSVLGFVHMLFVRIHIHPLDTRIKGVESQIKDVDSEHQKTNTAIDVKLGKMVDLQMTIVRVLANQDHLKERINSLEKTIRDSK